MANQCSAVDKSKTATEKKVSVNCTTTQSSKSKMFKQIPINNTRLDALIDTGSQITVMRKDVYKFKSDKLSRAVILITSSKKNKSSLSCFKTIIEINY